MLQQHVIQKAPHQPDAPRPAPKELEVPHPQQSAPLQPSHEGWVRRAPEQATPKPPDATHAAPQPQHEQHETPHAVAPHETPPLAAPQHDAAPAGHDEHSHDDHNGH